MKYALDFHYQPKGATELIDIGGVADIEIEEDGFGLVPAVGDYVDIPGDRDGNRKNFRGRVSRRTFRYVLSYCYVRIVLEEADVPD